MRVLLVALLLSLTGFSVFADSGLKTRFTDAELVRILQEDGYYSSSVVKDGVIRIKIDGNSYLLLNKEDGDLQTHFAIGGVKLSFEDVNEWNRTKRLSKAYLDGDNDPVIESDLLSNAGLTEKHVIEFFNIFKGSVRVFVDFVVSRKK